MSSSCALSFSLPSFWSPVAPPPRVSLWALSCLGFGASRMAPARGLGLVELPHSSLRSALCLAESLLGLGLLSPSSPLGLCNPISFSMALRSSLATSPITLWPLSSAFPPPCYLLLHLRPGPPSPSSPLSSSVFICAVLSLGFSICIPSSLSFLPQEHAPLSSPPLWLPWELLPWFLCQDDGRVCDSHILPQLPSPITAPQPPPPPILGLWVGAENCEGLTLHSHLVFRPASPLHAVGRSLGPRKARESLPPHNGNSLMIWPSHALGHPSCSPLPCPALP